jgi:hypothetical protein
VSTAIPRRPAARFAFAALVVVTVCALVLRLRAHSTNADIAAWGVTFDLTITIPLLYWFFVVRAGKARALTIAPLFVVCAILATALVPRGQQQFLRELARAGGAVAETLLIGALIYRLAKFRKSDSSDPYERFHNAAQTIAGNGVIATAIASEVAMFYYALFCWKKKPSDERAITFHQRNDWSTILICILVMIGFESIGMHLFIAQWKPAAAWLWTAFDLWAAIWLLGDYHALRLRHTTIDDDALHLRYGMRWHADVALTSIISIDDVQNENEWKRRGVLKVAILDEPRWLIRLRDPIVARGLAGMRKTITAIAMLPDDENAISALRTAHAAAVARAEHP